MVPWIIVGVAALIGAAKGGFLGLVLGAAVGVAANVALGEAYLVWARREQRKLELVGGSNARARPNELPPGAAPLPWDVTEEDIQSLRTFSKVLGNGGFMTQVITAKGRYGDQLELLPVPTQPNNEPIAILTRLWDPDVMRLTSHLMFAGSPQSDIVHFLESQDFELLFASDDPTAAFVGTMFIRRR